MKYNLYSLLDSKVKAYAQPFFSVDNSTAVEALREFVNNDCPIADCLVDYNAFCVGEFDDYTGMLIPLNSPIHLVPLIQLLNPKE